MRGPPAGLSRRGALSARPMRAQRAHRRRRPTCVGGDLRAEPASRVRAPRVARARVFAFAREWSSWSSTLRVQAAGCPRRGALPARPLRAQRAHQAVGAGLCGDDAGWGVIAVPRAEGCTGSRFHAAREWSSLKLDPTASLGRFWHARRASKALDVLVSRIWGDWGGCSFRGNPRLLAFGRLVRATAALVEARPRPTSLWRAGAPSGTIETNGR